MNKANIYEDLKVYVGTSKGLGIPTEDMHQDRLHLAARLLNRCKPQHLLDVGCGYGDLRLLVPGASYLGIDACQWFVDEAHHRQPATRFQCMRLDELTPNPMRYDAAAALGVLATVDPEDLPAFMDRLAMHASRWLVVSFVPADGPYSGRWLSHDRNAVLGHFPVIETGIAHGEVTALLDISR